MTEVMGTLEQTSEPTERQLVAALAFKKLKVIEKLNPGIAKNGYNETQKYPFPEASDVKKGVGAAFVEFGLAIRVTMADIAPERVELDSKDTTKIKPWRLTVWYRIDLIDCETGWIESSLWPSEVTLHGNDDKGWNKCSTQAVKYYLLANFLVGTKEDDALDIDGAGDANENSGSRNQPQRQQRNNNNQRQQRQNQQQQRAPLTNGHGEPRDMPPARNGNGNGATPARNGNGQAAPATAPAMLSATDETKWPNFLVWANGQYGMDEPAVKAAIWQLTKKNEPFNGERNHAIAALLAAAAKYDPKFIAATAKGKELITDAVIQKATEIARGYTLPE